MMNKRTFLTWVVVCGAVAMGLLAGCPPQPPMDGADPAPAVTTTAATATDSKQTAANGTTTTDANTTVAPALPAKATTPLADLEPALAKPDSAPGELTDQTRDLVTQAEADIAARQFSAAVDKLRRAAGFDPENPRILKNLGMAYFGRDYVNAAPTGKANTGMALQNLQAAANKNGDDLDLQLLLGQVLEAAAKPDDAIASYRTALLTSQAKPDDGKAAEALARLADLLARQGYLTASLEAYDQLNDWIALHAEAYVGRPMVERLVLRPELVQVQRARLLLKLNRPADALAPLEQARETDRNNTAVTGLLIEAQLASGKTDKARALLQEMADGGDTSANLANLVEKLANAQKNPALPREIWQTYLRHGKRDTATALAMAAVAVKLGAESDAQAILQSALEYQPGNLQARKQLADLFSRQKQTDKALRELAVVVATDVNQSLDVASRVQQAVLRDGAFDVAAFVASLDDAGKDPQALRYVAGLAAARKKDYTAAADQQRRAIALDKEFLPAWDALLEATLATRQNAAVEKVLQDSTTLPQDRLFGFHLYLIAKVEMANADVASTHNACEKLYQARRELANRGQNYLPLSYTLAQALRRTNRTNDAARVLSEAIDLQPDNDQLQVELVRLLMAAGAVDSATKRLDELLARQDDSIAARIVQVELLIRQGRKEQALDALAGLKKTNPKDPQVLMLDFRIEYGQRMGSLSKEDFQKAAAALAELIRADEDNAEALDSLARLLSQSRFRAEAMTMWESAYEWTNRHPQIARQYAAALYQARQYAKAEGIIRDILAASPKDTAFRLMLLETLKALKKNDDAITLAQTWLRDTQESHFEYRVRLLMLYKEEKRHDDAHALLDDWIQLEANRERSVALRSEKLSLFAKAEQYKEAEEFAENWIVQEQKTLGGQPMIPQLQLLEALREARQYDQSLRLLGTWIGGKNDASVRNLRLWQIRMLVLADKIPDALRRAQAWIRQSPNALGPRSTLVSALQEAELHDQAEALLEKWLGEMTADGAIPPASWFGPDENGQSQGIDDEDEEGDDDVFFEDEDDEDAFPGVGQIHQANIALPPALAQNVDDDKADETAPADAEPAEPAAQPEPAPAAQVAVAAPAGAKVHVSQEMIDWARCSLVIVLSRQKKYDQAIAKADEFIETYPKDYFTARAYARHMLLRLPGQEASRVRTYTNPVLSLLQLKSHAQMEQNKPLDAMATLERAFTIDPDNANLNNDLGYQYADLGIHLEKAERMIRKALMEEPNPAYLDSLAWVLYKQGKFDQADRIFDQIFADDSEDHSEHAIMYDHAGDVAWRLGDKDKARALWTKAVETAQNEKRASLDSRKVLATTPAKLEAAQNNTEPDTAPLGNDVDPNAVREDETDEESDE